MGHAIGDRTHAEAFNADGDTYRPDLTGGCAPIAISIAFQMPLRRTVLLCRRLGRRLAVNGGTTPPDTLHEKQPRVTKAGYWNLPGTSTRRTVAGTPLERTFIMLMDDHVAVVVDGVLIDSVDRRSEKVEGLYEVHPPEALLT